MFSRQSAQRWQLGCQPYTPAAALLSKNIFISLSGAHFYQRLSKALILVQLEGLDKLIKIFHLNRSSARNLAPKSLSAHL
jgi:hypothetical protein